MANIVVFFLSALVAVNASASVTLGDSVNIPLRTEFSYFHDESGKLSLEEVGKQSFSEKPIGGFFDGVVWAKTDICSSAPKNLHFVYKDPIESIDVFLGSQLKPSSYKFLNIRGLAKHFWVDIPLEIKKGCSPILARFKSGDVMNFGISLMDGESFRRIETNFLTFYSVYYALFSLILLIVFFFLFKFRTRMYFFFAALVITQDILGASLLNGFIFRFVMSPSSFVEYDIGNIFALLMNASLVAFAISFLKERFKVATYLSWTFVAVQLALVAPLLVNLLYPIHTQNAWLSQVVNQSILISCFWVLALAIADFGSVRARLFFFASGAKVGGQFVKTLLLQGDVSENLILFGQDMSFFVFNIGAIGSLIEAFAIVGILMASYFKDIEKKNRELKSAMEELKKSKMEQALVSLSKGLAHDIRGPLSALNLTLQGEGPFDDERRQMAKQAAQRIGDIAHNLLNRKPGATKFEPLPQKVQKYLLSDVVESILAEKRVQYAKRSGLSIDLETTGSVYSAFAMIDRTEFQRVLSNIIDNAAEAIEKDGYIVVGMEEDFGNQVCIYVSDTGRGIPGDVLPKLCQEGFSFAKNGSGLGLFHARRTIEGWAGEFKIDSTEKVGTNVSILLPMVSAPAWFESKLELKEGQNIVIVEDEQSVRNVWKDLIQKAFDDATSKPGSILTFSNGFEFSEWLKTNVSNDVKFILDYDLGEGPNGLELIEKHRLEGSSTLVTSLYGEREIQRKCEEMRVRCIPKVSGEHLSVEILNQDSLGKGRTDVFKCTI